MRRPSHSIRLRIVAVTALVATVLLGALASLLAVRTAEIARTAASQLAVGDLSSFAVDLRRQPQEAPDPAAKGVLVQVVAPDGTVRRDSMPVALSRAALGVRGAGEVTVAGGRYYVATERVTAQGGTWRLAAARDLTAGDALVSGVRMTLLVGTPIAVLVTALAAWLVTGAAFRPVERMRETAERLRSPGARGRLPMTAGRELAELSATLNGLIDDLRASADHERRVTADTAHELRTPLAVLALQVQLADRPGADPDLPAIRASVDRLGRLTDDLLLLARADRDEATGRAAVAQLVTEAMGAVDDARLLAPPHVSVDLVLDADESGAAAIDPVAFGRVLTNLVANAIAAGPASSVVIELRTADGELRLAVRDDGPGFPPEFLAFAFDRFSRPEHARGSGATGAGLGLALVQRLVQRAGGAVDARNLAGGGAVVTATLPVDGGATAGEPAPSRATFEDSNAERRTGATV